MSPPPPPPPSTAVVGEDAAVAASEAAAAALRAPSALQEIRSRRGLRGILPLLGPAFVAAVAYVDPGNFATNVSGGAKYGYSLLWVILAANVMAMLVQTLSAKVGVATGRNLPELCREHFPRRVSRGLWIQAELIAMATDLAEFIGAAIALNLLFGVPLFVAGLMTAVVAFGILALQARGHRRFEVVVTGLLGIILLGFLYDTFKIGADGGEVARGFLPSFQSSGAVFVATGIIGATVMPHVIYLHSALTQDRTPVRDESERKRVLRFLRLDVLIAMTAAGAVNIAMLVVASSLFHGSGIADLSDLGNAYHGFQRLSGHGSALAFALALLASGLASSSVGTYAGQVVMQGFIARTIPLAARRLVTMAPALVVLGLGLDPTKTLVLSQVILSFGIPFALVPLVMLTSRRSVMGAFVNHRGTTVAAIVVATVISALNVFLLGQTFFG